MNIFSVESPLYKFMLRLWDMFKLNFMWLICSIPIVTMGAATTAAYTITLKMVKDEEGYICRPFFKEFKRNIKKGSIIGVIFEVACYAIYLDFQLYQKANHSNLMFLIVGIIAVYLVIMHFIYAFALLARYENSVINTLKNSYSIAAKYFGRTLFLIVLVAFECCIIAFNYTTMFVGVFFGPACIILTISGFARQFFMLVEQDNDIKAEEATEAKETMNHDDEMTSEDEEKPDVRDGAGK